MRIIDADNLSEIAAEWQEKALNKVYTIDPIGEHEKWEVWYAIFNERTAFMHDIADAPTIDAVYVVRCKDCKYNQGSACDYSAVWTRPNGFCQWGERKDDKTDAPAVNAKPVKHGRWVKNEEGDYHCSECNAIVESEERYWHYWRYCYNCGARMETEEMME